MKLSFFGLAVAAAWSANDCYTVSVPGYSESHTPRSPYSTVKSFEFRGESKVDGGQEPLPRGIEAFGADAADNPAVASFSLVEKKKKKKKKKKNGHKDKNMTKRDIRTLKKSYNRAKDKFIQEHGKATFFALKYRTMTEAMEKSPGQADVA